MEQRVRQVEGQLLPARLTYQDESRAARGQVFPFVDVFEAGTSYLSFGFEPFTPNNELRYSTFQVQNNLTTFTEKHSWTFGAYVEKYHSDNVFFRRLLPARRACRRPRVSVSRSAPRIATGESKTLVDPESTAATTYSRITTFADPNNAGREAQLI